MFKSLRIRYKIALGLTLILSVIMIPLGFLITNYRHTELTDSLKLQGEGIAALMASSGAEAILKFQDNRLDELVKSACSSPAVLSCVVYNTEGEIYSRFPAAVTMPEDNVFYVEKRILRDGEYLGFVKVGVRKDDKFESHYFVLNYLLPLFLGCSVIGGILASFFLGRVLICPVLRIAGQARGIAHGDFELFNDDGRKDELGELVRSLNQLARKFSLINNELDQKSFSRNEELEIINSRLSDELREKESVEKQLGSSIDELSFTVKELAKSRDKAERSSKFKSHFLAMISHEIRTPMNAILGMGDLLLETDLDPEQLGYVEIFKGSGELLLKIINDILDFVQIESGLIELVPVPFDPSQDLQGVCKSMAYSAHARDIEIICDVDTDVPSQVMGDPVRVRQILMNIVSNAVKYTSSGEVDVQLSLEDSTSDFDRLLFTVRDTGIGISEGKRGSVFESFVQAEGAAAREFGGIGLGLAAASRLADLMDGEIRFDSKRGEGTVFYFSIPFKKSTYELDRSVVDFSGTKVLLIDDNRTVREVLCRRLQTFGIEVATAADGSEGLEYLKAAAEHAGLYDLLLVDSDMPDMSGNDFLKEVRHESLRTGAVAMMFSAGCSEEERLDARMLGASHTLIKPVFDADLIRCLQDSVEKEQRGQTGKNMKILLVEDNEDHRRILELFIADTGAELTMAEDGLQAVQFFSENNFDLVFMDLELPVMSGIESTGRIRELEQSEGRKPVVIVALAAHAFDEYRARCRAAGFDGFIAKPVRWDIIRSTIAAVADNSDLNANILIAE